MHFYKSEVTKISKIYSLLIINLILSGCKSSLEIDTITCVEGFHNCSYDTTECCENVTGDFLWSTYVLPECGFDSHIFDCGIVNSNNIWATGKYCIIDSVTNSMINTDAAHWDGNTWQHIEVPVAYVNPEGEIANSGISTLYTVHVFNDTSIWFSGMINSITSFNGNDFGLYAVEESWPAEVGYDAYSMWGITPQDIIIGSVNGFIMHFDGINFTELWQLDYPSSVTKIVGSDEVVFILANTQTMGLPVYYQLLRYQSDAISEVYCSMNSSPDSLNFMGGLEAIWLFESNLYIMSLDGLYLYSDKTDSFIKLFTRDEIGCEFVQICDIVGNSPDDLILIGDEAQIYHYNGQEWTIDTSLSDTGNYRLHINFSADYQDETVAIGCNYNDGVSHKATVILGTRMN